MQSFGVHFRIDRPDLLGSLVSVFAKLREAKEIRDFRDLQTWVSLLPEDVRSYFYWPGQQRENRPVIIAEPADALGAGWDFPSFLYAIENGEYTLVEVVKTSESTAELRIEPEAYPYGGLGAFKALVEAHGMYILGVNEYGQYQPREELVGLRKKAKRSSPRKPWWKLW